MNSKCVLSRAGNGIFYFKPRHKKKPETNGFGLNKSFKCESLLGVLLTGVINLKCVHFSQLLFHIRNNTHSG